MVHVQPAGDRLTIVSADATVQNDSTESPSFIDTQYISNYVST